MTTKIMLSGCGMLLVLGLAAACGERETPLAPAETGTRPSRP